jgi:hypothetical protein
VIDTGFVRMEHAPDGRYEELLATVGNLGDAESSDGNQDDFVDPDTGHGTFIGGLYGRLAPGADVVVTKLMSTFGDITDAEAGIAINKFVQDAPEGQQLVISMSFRGYTQEDDPPITLAAAIHEADGPDIAFVASAGNDASCRPTWPAVLQHVIGVGALGPGGPAPFTNYGPHVQACAPGVDVISTFRGEMDPDRERKYANPASDLADYQGWACWSGTSFSAPIVGAELAWEAMSTGQSMHDVVERRIKDEGLTRIAGLGTIVNVC